MVANSRAERIPSYMMGDESAYVSEACIRKHKIEKPIVENIVVVMDTHAPIDLHLIASIIPNIEFRPDHFAAASYRIGKKTLLIYATGKTVLAGCKDIEEAQYYVHLSIVMLGCMPTRIIEYKKQSHVIEKEKYMLLSRRMKPGTISVANVVAKRHFDKSLIDLDEIYTMNRATTLYSPSTFPGIRVIEDNEAFTLFDTGSMLGLGLKMLHRLPMLYRLIDALILHAHRSSKTTDAVRHHIWTNYVLPPRETRPYNQNPPKTEDWSNPADRRVQRFYEKNPLRHTPHAVSQFDTENTIAAIKQKDPEAFRTGVNSTMFIPKIKKMLYAHQ